MSSRSSCFTASAVLIAGLALAIGSSVQAENASKPETKPGKPSMIQTSEAAKPASYNAKALRRLDFRVVGKSCAVCLMKIQRTMKTLPGVVKVAVMLRKPYGGVIVYDSSKVSKNKLLETVLAQDKDVRVEQQIDNAISKVPAILIPLYGIPKTSAKNASEG